MDKVNNQNNDSYISTTVTPNSYFYADTLDKKFVNLNFVENSDASTQKELLVEYQKLQNSGQDESSKVLSNKILPAFFSLNGVEETESVHEIPLNEKSLLEMGYKADDVDGWEHIIQPAKEDLYKLLKNMIDNHINPSVQVRIGDVSFNCHMLVLQCYSDFFLECNNEILIQLPEEKVTPSAFMMVYDWMISSHPLVQREGILELFNAANFLRIRELINQCWLCLDDDVCFREDTAFILYLEARNFGLEDVEQLMLMRICKFFLTLVACKEYLALNANEICTLLSSNTIGVNSEIEIFMSAVRWLNHDWPERQRHVFNVIKCVRFSLIPPWFLVTLNKNSDCFEIDRIVEDTDVKKMINDGITYSNIQLYFGNRRQEFLHLLERLKLVAPMQRQWVYDKQCKYHHHHEYPNMENISYRSFLEYLEMVRSTGRDYWRFLEMDKGTERSMHRFLYTDCLKSTESNLDAVFTKASRDQAIQCQSGLKNRKSRAAIHNKVGGKRFIHRTPRGHPSYAPSAAPRTNKFINNDIATETETTVDLMYGSESDITTETETNMDLKYIPKSDIKLHFDEVEQQKQEEQREIITHDTCKHQQQLQQTDKLQADVIQQENIIDRPPLRPKPSNNAENDEKLNQRQQLLSKTCHKKLQQQKQQEHEECELPHSETLTDNCCTLIYRCDAGLMAGVSEDSIGTQQQDNRQQCITDDEIDSTPMKHDVEVVIKAAAGDSKKNGDNLLISGDSSRISTFGDGSTRIQNYNKVLLFGGIDPYCLPCQDVQQHQQIHERKAPRKELKQQQQKQQQQELVQRKRVHSIDAIIMNTTSHSHPLNSHHMPTKARAHTQTYSTNTAANRNCENFGDHVLHYAIDAMEWRHLSHIPFGSRHHHAVVVCNGLIYVIGGTRTALGWTKKLVFEKTVWCFNPNTLKWSLETNLPESRRDFAAIATDDQNQACNHDIGFYVIGGEGVNGGALNTVWFYNIKRKLWLKKPSLNVGRYGFAAAVVNNDIWVAGGIINDNNSHAETVNVTSAYVITDTIEIYNLKCMHCDDALTANNHAEGLSNNECLQKSMVVVGEQEGACDASKTCERVTFLKNKPEHIAGNGNCILEGQWIKSKLHLRIPRLFGRFCKMENGQLYVVGGISFNDQQKLLTSLTDIDLFNGKLQQWEHVGDLNLARHGHDVALLNDHCFVVIGGVSASEQCTLSTVEAFCIETRKCYKDLPDLPWPVSGCAAATLK